MFKVIFLFHVCFTKFLVSDNQNNTETTTTSPMTSSTSPPEIPPTVDYNGENVTVTNITQDYHRYYNRYG